MTAPAPTAEHAAARTPHLRTVLDVGLSWLALVAGLYSAAIEPVRRDNDVQIAVGIEAVILAVIGLLWSGHLRHLGAAVIVVGVATPAVGYLTAPLFWDDVSLFGEAFLTTVVGGAGLGLPLVLLGVFILRRSRRPAPRKDPAWFAPLRWPLQGGLLIILAAFRAGDWANGILLVYAGAALALIALLIAVPYRFATSVRGMGRFILYLGLVALAVIGAAALALGQSMSPAELQVGLVPAAAVAALGLVIALVGSPRAFDRGTAPRPEAELGGSADLLDVAGQLDPPPTSNTG